MQLVLGASPLSHEERTSAKWFLASHSASSQPVDRDIGGPLSIERPLENVINDWEELYAKPRQPCIDDVIYTLRDNSQAYYESKEEYDAVPPHFRNAVDNYGFDENAEKYPFDEEDRENNIVFQDSEDSTSGVVIKCATLDKLIERVTHEEYVDINTRYVFLLTYRSFTDPIHLLEKLAQRYLVPVPPNLTPDEVKMFKESKLHRIQIRVWSVLKNWLTEHISDFDESMFPVLFDFCFSFL